MTVNHKKIKLCLVKWVIDVPGGGEKVAISLANELSKSPEFDVHLIGITSETEYPFFSVDDKVQYTNLCCQQPRPKLYQYALRAIRQLRAYIRKHDIDIVVSIGIATNGLATCSTIGTPAKLVVCEHVNGQSENQRVPNKLRRFVGAKCADRVVTLTEEDRQYYQRKYRLQDRAVICIPNWIDDHTVDIPYNPQAKRLITIGRFSRQKGYDLLAKVASNVLKQNRDWVWDIYGNGDSTILAQLKEDLEQSGVYEQVHFKGTVTGAHNLYPNHGLYVMTSYYEGLPLVLLEAKQCGLPIVSFSCPTGPSEIVEDGINGYLIEPFNINEMSDRINELIVDADKRLAFSKASMMNLDRFNKQLILSQWKSLFRGLVE